MPLMIESMESRVLFTASAGVILSDLAAGASALSTSKSDLKVALKEATLDIKGFKTDIKGVKLTPAQKATLATLTKTEATDAAKVSSAITKILASGVAHGAALEGQLKSLKAHPTSASAQAKVATALAKLQAVFSITVITNVETQLGTAVTALDTDLDAVAAAIPSTQGTVTSTESDFSTDQTTLTIDVASIESAITTLATDLA